MSWMWTVLPSSSVRPTHEPRLGPSEILLKYSAWFELDCLVGRSQPKTGVAREPDVRDVGLAQTRR